MEKSWEKLRKVKTGWFRGTILKAGVHSMWGPLSSETNASEADSTFIRRVFSGSAKFDAAKLGKF